MYDVNGKNNEFDWERELRRDDRRIRGYFQALPHWIDLPKEEEAIFETMSKQPGLVPSGLTASGAQFASGIQRDWDIDDEEAPERTASEQVLKLDALVVEWNLLAATALPPADFETALVVSCKLNQLLLRLDDANNFDSAPALRCSLYKRALRDINSVIGDLQKLAKRVTAEATAIKLLMDLLQSIRTTILTDLAAWRSVENNES